MEKSGRVARLIELDPKYVDVIVRRLQDRTGKQATRELDGALFDDQARASGTAEMSAQLFELLQPSLHFEQRAGNHSLPYGLERLLPSRCGFVAIPHLLRELEL